MALQQPFTFVLPDSHAAISGGNLYNAALLAALQEQHSAVALPFEEFRKEASGAGTFLIDSLNLAAFHALGCTGSASRRHVLLVHHLPSLEPGLDADDPMLLVEPAALASFDAFVCTSKFTSAYLRSLGHRQPMLTIEPVIDSPEPVNRPLHQSAVALMSCNLIARKGVLAFLEGLLAGTTDADDYRLDIVGRHDLEPRYGAACQDCVRTSSELSSRVTLHGEIAFNSMSSWYQKSNLFVSASRMETFGISLQEARAFGLPILAVVGGNSANHVRDGVTGQLFSDPAKLAQGFLSLVRSPPTFASYRKQAQEQRPSSQGDWADSATKLAACVQSWFS